MRQATLGVETSGRGAIDVTADIGALVRGSDIDVGVANVFIRHTSASLMICENADPQVLRDLERFMTRLAPDGDPLFDHVAEGPDDMPAHVRSVLTQSALTIPIRDGRLALGTWQGVFLYEHRTRPHSREIIVSIVG